MRWIKIIPIYEVIETTEVNEDGIEVTKFTQSDHVLRYELSEYTSTKFPGESILIEQGYIKYLGDKCLSELRSTDGLFIEDIPEEELEQIRLQEKEDELVSKIHMLFQNPDMVRCVREYKTLLDGLMIPYSATTAEMKEAAAKYGYSDLELQKLINQLLEIQNNLEVNIGWCNDRFNTGVLDKKLFIWENMTKMIELLLN